MTVPLFSIRTRRSWGIGEIGDLPDFAAWIAEAGIGLVQILPLGAVSGQETSPYSALSAFGIDPVYVSIDDVPDWSPALAGPGDAAVLERARSSPTLDYAAVRPIKARALRAAFGTFCASEYARESARAEELAGFARAHREWLDDYTLFLSLKEEQGGSAWWDWPEALRARDDRALAAARERLSTEVLFHQYVQWIAHEQWAKAKDAAGRAGAVEIMGDLPFMVSGDSADVWANQSDFRLDCSVGTPPDYFSEEGQDWGLPPYYWERMRANDFAWLRRRARYAGALYDRFRVDHLVGFYRTYMRPVLRAEAEGEPIDRTPRLGPGTFDPATEVEQIAHGERVMRAMIEAAAEVGARLVAEDLGAVPDAVRSSLARLGVPGYRVVVWEREGQAFRDPRAYPEVSVACFGTHDTDPVATWWEAQASHDRAALARLLAGDAPPAAPEAFSRDVHRAVLSLLAGARSELALLLLQDVLGTRDRINVPGTQGPHNWTYRLPSPVEDLRADASLARWLAEVRCILSGAGRAPST